MNTNTTSAEGTTYEVTQKAQVKVTGLWFLDEAAQDYMQEIIDQACVNAADCANVGEFEKRWYIYVTPAGDSADGFVAVEEDDLDVPNLVGHIDTVVTSQGFKVALVGDRA